jgi:hypothetical protein
MKKFYVLDLHFSFTSLWPSQRLIGHAVIGNVPRRYSLFFISSQSGLTCPRDEQTVGQVPQGEQTRWIHLKPEPERTSLHAGFLQYYQISTGKETSGAGTG